jgi:protein O-GlcNAc transferase
VEHSSNRQGRGLSTPDGHGRKRAYAAAHCFFVNGQLSAAEAAVRRILVLHPRDFDALLLLAEIHCEKDQAKRAEILSRRAVVSKPGSPIAQHRLGVAFQKQKRYEKAARCFRRALALNPRFAEAHLDLGQALYQQGSLGQAVKSFHRALAINPELPHAQYRLGNALWNQGQIVPAIECYRRAIALKPDYAAALNNLAFTMNYDVEASGSEIYAAHRARAAILPPLQMFDRSYLNDRRPERRLRIGYVSGDFCEHSVSYFFEPLLASHNHSEVEVFAYSSLNRADEDEITARLRSLADHWTPICRLDDRYAAEQIREDRIDILIDLGGYTTRSRLALFALKPAPVQVTWLGYLNTTGLRAMDYRITDAIADPAGETDRFNSETLVRLRPPFLCYRPFDHAPPVSALPAYEAGHLTFGSFNDLPKLTLCTIKLWAKLLHSVRGSRLIIKTEQMRDAPTAGQLRSRFADEGIAPERIDLLAWRVRTVHHLARYGLVDVALDPFPFNGVTTTCEALWMGVPVVTLRGDRPYARVGASLLASVGLQDFVTEDPESYVEMAASLGNDIFQLRELRLGLRDRMRASQLCDGAGFARTMEQAYRRMWQNWCAQRPATGEKRDDCRPQGRERGAPDGEGIG